MCQYTKKGDKGKTQLVGGREVSKGEARIEAYGTVDELNAIVGLCRTFNGCSTAEKTAIDRIDLMLKRVQNDLFNLGADLATLPVDRWEGMILVSESDIKTLESWIDDLNKDLPALAEFILPGGGPVGAFLHQARTVCRRAERCLVRLDDASGETTSITIPYLNRLSDFFFVLGRWASKPLNEKEFLWNRNPSDLEL